VAAFVSAIACLAALPAYAATPPSPSSSIASIHRLGEPLQNATVVVTDGKIVAVGETGRVAIPPGRA